MYKRQGKNDLLVASGGNEYFNESTYLLSRLYLNVGGGVLEKKEDAFDKIFLTASCAVPHDLNGDGHLDLFLGARAVPWKYGNTPQSYLLLNDGTGKFKDVTNQYHKDLGNVGMVMDAKWTDLNGDKKEDLVVATEWGPIVGFIQEGKEFRKVTLTEEHLSLIHI